MNKQDLIKKIDSTWLSAKRKTELKEAVNSFEDALLRQYAVSGLSEQLKAFCQYCETRQIQPKRFNWDEVIKDFESL